jgi:hypothetical protein
MRNYAFQKGFSQVMNKDVQAVRHEIMEALNVTTRPAFLSRLRGEVEPKVSEAEKIEAIFSKYGVTDVWGEE